MSDCCGGTGDPEGPREAGGRRLLHGAPQAPAERELGFQLARLSHPLRRGTTFSQSDVSPKPLLSAALTLAGPGRCGHAGRPRAAAGRDAQGRRPARWDRGADSTWAGGRGRRGCGAAQVRPETQPHPHPEESCLGWYSEALKVLLGWAGLEWGGGGN